MISPARIPSTSTKRYGRIDRQIPVFQGDGRDRAEEACQKADRQIDMPDDDDQGHTDRQYGDIAGGIHQVADVSRRKKEAFGRDGKEHNDNDKGDIHAVITDILSYDLLVHP